MDYTVEKLGSNIKIFISGQHKFTTDTLLLANFSSEKKVKNALELCCGSGAISLIWCRDNISKNIYSVDIQEKACDLLKLSASYNKLNDRLHVINADLNNLPNEITSLRFDMIAVNPPYKTIGTGMLGNNDEKITANHEKECSIEEIIKISSKLLNFGGSLYLCCRTQRMAEIISCMQKYKLEPKCLQLVQQNIASPPKLFLIKACLGAKPFLNVKPVLTIKDENNQYTDNMEQIYGEYYNKERKIHERQTDFAGNSHR